MTIGPTLAAPDDDPFVWLEEVEGQRALDWIEEQNARTLARFGDDGFAADRDVLTAILDRPDNLPYITRRGGLIYNFWTDADNPRGLWRRTTLDAFRSPDTTWDVLIDVDALAKAEDEDWVWAGAATFPDDHERAIVKLSRGGGDAAVLREFDLVTRGFVKDGFVLPEAKGGVEWLDADTLLLASAHGEGRATASGYARTIRLWPRGTPVEDAATIFEADQSDLGVWASVDRTQAVETLWFIRRSGFFSVDLWIGDRTGGQTKLDLPEDIWPLTNGDWLALMPRTTWSVGDTTFAPGTVVASRLSSFLSGDRSFEVLFEPGERKAVQDFFWSGERMILSVLDNLKPVFEVFTPSDNSWAHDTLPDLPKIGVVRVSRLDLESTEGDGELLVNAQDPVTPPSLSLIEPDKAPYLLRSAPAAYDSAGLMVSQHEAVSDDGTRVPYVQVGPAETDGNAPVHLSGYGGFQISNLPHYQPSIGKLWLERGGTAVMAQIRGGGEFGPAWHEAGRREGKKLSHDDFAAIAADLVERGVTRPHRIAAEGGSNGGLLIANMLTRYPDHFGALFCTIPLVDMRRYTKLLAGASWIEEYGDPDRPEDWKFLQYISAYHTVEADRAYPPILLATTRRDDRVHPGHARKMAAKLQAMGHEAWFYEPEAGGHGYGKDNSERAAFTALGFRFLRESIGWSVE